MYIRHLFRSLGFQHITPLRGLKKPHRTGAGGPAGPGLRGIDGIFLRGKFYHHFFSTNMENCTGIKTVDGAGPVPTYWFVYWTQNLTYVLVFVPFDFDLKVRETTFCHEFLHGDKDRIVGEEFSVKNHLTGCCWWPIFCIKQGWSQPFRSWDKQSINRLRILASDVAPLHAHL